MSNHTSPGKLSGQDTVLEATVLQDFDLYKLLKRDASHIRIRNFIHPAVCEELSRRLLESDLYGHYSKAPEIGRVGRAFSDTRRSASDRAEYSKEAITWLRQLRTAVEPYLSPIDKLRLTLDEAWPYGATLASSLHGKLFGGLIRHFREGSSADPHVDAFDWECEDVSSYSAPKLQLAANIYISTPQEGGELYLWDVWPTKTEYDQMRRTDGYGLVASALPPVNDIIVPDCGDLILFNSHRVHSVGEITRGSRLSASCFVGFVDNQKPLVVWS